MNKLISFLYDVSYTMIYEIKCKIKGKHTIDESFLQGTMFKTEIETECLVCKLPLLITIERDVIWIEEY